MTPPPSPQRFVGPLESLRGVAALMVAVYHSFAVIRFGGIDRLWSVAVQDLPASEALLARMVSVFGNGSAAVTIFFVLSGVVLGMSLEHARGPLARIWASFIVKRVFRIYPAHVLITVVVVLALLGPGLGDSTATTTWFKRWYDRPVDWKLFLTNVALLNTYLNPITWTLITELAVALVFPFLFLASRRAALWLSLAVLFLLALPLLPWTRIGGPIFPHVYKFYLGLLLTVWAQPWIARVAAAGGVARCAYWTAAIVLLLVERAVRLQATTGLLESAGAAMIVAMLLFGQPSAFWESRPLRALGRCSYSFYLWHFPVLYLIAKLWTMAVPDALTWKFALPTSIALCLMSVSAAAALASLSYRWIEAPFIRHGKRAAALFQGRAP